MISRFNAAAVKLGYELGKRWYKRKIISLCIVAAALTAAAVCFAVYWRVIFQRGNPLPYIAGMLKLNSQNTYAGVIDGEDIIYITKRNDYGDLHEFIEASYGVEFVEQMRSGYIFRSEHKKLILTSEIYWKYYTVWTLSGA